MANEYGRWFVRNDPQTWQQNFGAYQRSFGERYERPPEYTPPVDEYRNYPAIKDILAEQEKKKEQLQQQDDASKKSNKLKQQSRTAQNAGRNIGNVIKNIAHIRIVFGYRSQNLIGHDINLNGISGMKQFRIKRKQLFFFRLGHFPFPAGTGQQQTCQTA